MTDTTDPRELLKNALRELQALRRRLEAVERDRDERPAVIGAACRLPGANSLEALASRGSAKATALPEVPAIDHRLFGLVDVGGAGLAPHLRLLLVTGWEAFEQAGWPPPKLPAERVGIYIGIGGSEVQHEAAGLVLPALGSAQVLARAFGLRGPVVNVDAGDASALAAVGLACRALLAREIDFALAGGVALVEGAQGAGEPAGCGLVILKRLAEAVAERDGIVAVVQAWSTSLPGDARPALELNQAISEAGGVVDGSRHAAGEVGLAAVDGLTEVHKAEVGHLKGLAALLRALLAVQPGKGSETALAIAAGHASQASIAVQAAPAVPEPNDRGPYLLLLSAQDGPALEASAGRLAAHLQVRPEAELGRIAFTLRAGRAHLTHRRYVIAHDRQQAIDALQGPPSEQAACQQPGRAPVFLFPGLGSQYLNMARGLYDGERVFRDVVDQCAQLLQPHLEADIRSITFGASSGAPSGASGAGKLDLRKMLRRQDGPVDPAAARLDQTIYAQPALFVVEYALAQLLAAWGLRPAAMLGYSLGEYVAACLAGVVSLEDALALVAARARLIAALPVGKMAAVPLPEAAVAPLLRGGLEISAVNGQSLCVIAGEPAAVEALAASLARDAIATQVLPATHAFHTTMLRPMAEPFRQALSQVRLNPPAVPYISNLTGDWITPAEATSADYWLEHACRPVRFAAGIEALHRAGHELQLEVGPSQALTSLAGAVARELGASARPIPTMRWDYDPQRDSDVLHKAVGELWLAGATLDWGSFRPSRRISAPGYAFDHAEAARQDQPAAAQAGATPTELALAELWRDLLKAPEVDPRRTFFEHGGNSLQAAQLIFRIKKAFGVTLRLRALFEAPGLAAMAGLIDGHSASPAISPPDSGLTSRAPSAAGGLAITLPNGLDLLCQNRQEVGHFYEDIFVDRVYVRRGIRLPAGAVVFDVGANIGLFSLFAHLEAPGARLYAFEPVPAVCELLRANLARHGANATVYNCALASRPGTAELTYYPRSTGMSSLYADLAEERAVLETVLRNQMRRGESELAPLLAHAGDYLAERLREERFLVRLRTLSDVMAEAEVERIDLLKIDVQKAELEVLLGLADGDWPRVRQIVVEVHDIDGRLNRLRRMLEGRGFRVETDQEALYVGSPIYLLYGHKS